MTLHTWIAVLGAAPIIAYLFAAALSTGPGPRVPWRLAAAACAAFTAFSAWAIAVEGPLGFWPEHVRHLWGNQIWFDLVLAASVAFTALLPRARAVGARPLPWLLLTLGLGSIGLLAFAARVLYLEDRARVPA